MRHMPHRAGKPTVSLPCSGGMPPPQPQGFPGIPKSPFLACPLRHLQLPSPGWQGSNAEKTFSKVLIPRTCLSVVCMWGLGRTRAGLEGGGHFSLSLSCFALGQQTDLTVSNPTSGFLLLDSGARGLIILFSALGTLASHHPPPHGPLFYISGGWDVLCGAHCTVGHVCVNARFALERYFMQIQKQATLNSEVQLCEVH